jgi:hypothetical protein
MLSVVRVNVVAPNMIDTREKTKDNTEYMFGAWKKSTQIGVRVGGERLGWTRKEERDMIERGWERESKR